MSKEKILQDFFDFGFSKRTRELIPSSDETKGMKITFRNINGKSQDKVEEALKDLMQEPQRRAMQKYAIHILSHTLIKWGNKEFDTSEEWYDYLEDQSVVLLDKAIKMQQQFEKDIQEALEVESVRENFSPTGVQIDASKPSPEELNQESEEASEKQ